MKSVLSLFTILLPFYVFHFSALNGTWEYKGGIYNGKPQGPTAGYTLQRRYDDLHYQSFLISKDEQPEKYEAGDYTMNNDTCLETQTFSAQPSSLTGRTLKYRCVIRNDTLLLSGTLPSGMSVIEYWKKTD